jgi:hypothetical protein
MHELNCMAPLPDGNPDDENREWPFRWTANIVNPFNILQSLGIDVSRQLDFDIWVIQLILRKLHKSVLAWYKSPGSSDIQKSDPKKLKDLYIHTGFSIFTHTCEQTSNAEWMWGWWTDPRLAWKQDFHPRLRQEKIPNRILIRTTEDTRQGERIKLSHSKHDDRDPAEWFQVPLSCEGCNCPRCKDRRKTQKEIKQAQYIAEKQAQEKRVVEERQHRERERIEANEILETERKEKEKEQQRQKQQAFKAPSIFNSMNSYRRRSQRSDEDSESAQGAEQQDEYPPSNEMIS